MDEQKDINVQAESLNPEQPDSPANPELDRRFRYHPPKGESQVKRYEYLRDYARGFAYAIDHCCPNSREKSLAWTALEESVMWANAAIARNE